MITDETVRQLFQSCQKHIPRNYWRDDALHTSQFFRGITPRLWKNSPPGHCRRHKLVFNTFNIIPKFCFDCYKVAIAPRNVIELFKLMMIFEQLKLPSDNTRKCMVEVRPKISGAYKGFIYSPILEEAKEIFNTTQELISQEISPKVRVSLSRGCSEYSLVYPEYAQIKEGNKPVMEYKHEWQKYEDLADKSNLAAHIKPIMFDSYNHPGFNLPDALAMLCWLKYAATIGDLSYMKVTDQPIPKLQQLSPRPPIQLAEDE